MVIVQPIEQGDIGIRKIVKIYARRTHLTNIVPNPIDMSLSDSTVATEELFPNRFHLVEKHGIDRYRVQMQTMIDDSLMSNQSVWTFDYPRHHLSEADTVMVQDDGIMCEATEKRSEFGSLSSRHMNCSEYSGWILEKIDPCPKVHLASTRLLEHRSMVGMIEFFDDSPRFQNGAAIIRPRRRAMIVVEAQIDTIDAAVIFDPIVQ